MLHVEILSNGLRKTYSDRFLIRQKDTGNIYEEAVDRIPHEYEETDTPRDIPDVPESDIIKELEAIL